MNRRLDISLGRLPGARRLGAIALALGTLTLLFFALRSKSPAAATPIDRFVLGGVAVELGIEPVDPAARGAPLREGEDVTFRFSITDARTGAPLSRVAPAAWVDGRDPRATTDEATCGTKVKAFLGASSLAAGQLDLTTFQVLVMNEDATISVVDPRFGFGGSKLLTMVFLKSPAADWALTEKQTQLFVSMPAVDRVAVVDPASFKVQSEIEVGPRPTRLALQPDEGYLWILGDDASTTVTAVSVTTLAVAARIRVGAGHHAIAFSNDSHFAFVTNHDSGTVSIVDIAKLAVTTELATGRAPGAVAFSSAARAAYITDADEGTITAVDPERRVVVARIPAKTGVSTIAFDRRGRFGFAPSPDQDTVQVVDAAANRIVQTGHVQKGPDQIAFSDTIAYVRHRGSEEVMMIPLDQVGSTDKAMAVADFPGGQLAPGSAPIAQTIVDVPGEPAVLVVNSADKAIYYYREGMAAPMGNFDAYGHVPKAVLVVDRSLRERVPGVYETTVRLDRSGPQDVAFLMASPRLIHCFAIDVARDPGNPVDDPHPVAVELLAPRQAIVAGQPVKVRLRLTDPSAGTPHRDLADLTILTYLAPGIWQKRQRATAEGDGVYSIELLPPAPGAYSLVLQSPSIRLAFKTPQHLVLLATEPTAGGAP